jgi:5-methylcytosine-specific restriction endonuclease McrA
MYVDHIVPLRLCSDKERVASSNLWTLCGKCHNKKSRQEAKTSDKKLQRMSRLDWQRVLKN